MARVVDVPLFTRMAAGRGGVVRGWMSRLYRPVSPIGRLRPHWRKKVSRMLLCAL